jgi:TPR repeat protein
MKGFLALDSFFRKVTMRRPFFQIVLTGLLILSSRSSPLLAQTPRKPEAEAFPGSDWFHRGWTYDQGLGTPINMPEAIRSYRKAAALSHPLGKARLARIYFSGNGVEQDTREAERLCKGVLSEVLQAAERGDGLAQVIAGTMYADGLGVARDSAEALTWLRKAADQNVALAQANLGVMYENGLGVGRDITAAVYWYAKAARQNNAMGKAYLGDLYKKGRGVPRDEFAALQLYRLAAAQNYAHAQNNLGYMYEHGCVVERNPWVAVWLYRLAAEQNFAVAQTNLATMYEKGCGVWPDLNAAVMWYRRVAAQGDRNAIRALRCLGYAE